MPAKALSDDDARQQLILLSKIDTTIAEKITQDFGNAVVKLVSITIAACQDDEDDLVELDRLQRILRNVPADEMFVRAKDKIWESRKHIIAKDIEHFLNRDYRKNIKRDHNQVFLESLVEIIKTRFSDLSPEDRELYWGYAATLLNLVTQYKLALRDAGFK